MTARTPVEFTRDVGGGIYERVGNQVVIANPTTGASNPTDPITGALVAIDAVHYEIHEGEFFSVSYKSPDASPIVDNGTVIFALTTGSKYCHLIASANSGGDGEAELLEGATITGGTPMTVYNHKRDGSVDTTTVTVVRDPTVNVAGTLLEHSFMPGGRGPNAVGTTASQRSEWILRRNTIYLLRITNRAGTAQPISLTASWYEESSN